MTGPREVEVWTTDTAGDRRVGTLRPSFTSGRVVASSSFEYDPGFLADGWQISPDLPLRAGRTYTAENSTLPGALSDAAPDDWGQKLTRADHAHRRRGDPALPARLGEFDYLLGVSDRTRMGALRLRGSEGAPWLSDEQGVANLRELPRILDAARRFDLDEATDEDIAYLGDVATSPGGARPKANVVMDGGRLAIAKLPHSKDGRIDVERWEAVVLTIAREAGLQTPRWRLEMASDPDATRGSPRDVTDRTRSVLITERFDRDRAGLRLGYLSGRTALGLGANDDGSRMTYEDFADVIDARSVASAIDLAEMFGRIALTVLVNNVDDHWRNHGFLHGPAGWRLAPMFDVNPSRQRGVLDSRAISAADDPADRRLSSLIAIADAFRLRAPAARSIVQRMAVAVSAWNDVAARLAVPAEQRDLLRGAFESPQLPWALALDA
ncbi:MAG: type II toxin-antitoxin system HipA family toxin [Herbiconiux sp.]|nr:type II toxin-antitoxin system HipA family toxin [Herbiconiux sp.]